MAATEKAILAGGCFWGVQDLVRKLDGVTEVRAGVYVFFDLVMFNVGVCTLDDLALSVLTTVIGHQPEKGWAIVDAGWMAMSRDRGTARLVARFRLRAAMPAERHSTAWLRGQRRQSGARHSVSSNG